MYLLDTVVLSELRKTGPNRGVISFLTPMAPDTLFLSSMTIGEIEAGIQRQRGVNPKFAAELAHWLAATETRFAGQILPVTPAVAKLWGRLCVLTGNKGVDNLIAATALHHGLTVVTRNAKHFEQTDVSTLDPFE